jgi:stress response protein YsnF
MAEARTTIPVVEEELAVSKRAVRTGTVRVETTTEEVDDLASAVLESSDVEVVRVAVGREVDQVPGVRTEGDTTIVPVLEEVMVVQKRLVLKEELHIRRRVTAERVEVPVTLRRQSATVTRSDE